MGLIVSVYANKDRYDATNNGVTKRFERLCVINVDGPFEPENDRPAVELLAGALDGTAILRPVEAGTSHTMFGGNYAATSDTRFSRAIKFYIGGRFHGAVAIHDRDMSKVARPGS